MRGLILILPVSATLWIGIIWLVLHYGLEAIGLLIAAGCFLYIIGTIWRDWAPITTGEWSDGDTGPFYGRDPKGKL